VKHTDSDEPIHVARLAMSGMPALLIVGFIVVAFLSLFPLEEVVVVVAGVLLAGALGAVLLHFVRRAQARSVLNLPGSETPSAPPAPTRPK
jgi:hypothetical protein